VTTIKKRKKMFLSWKTFWKCQQSKRHWFDWR